jgi:hypothetical protein
VRGYVSFLIVLAALSLFAALGMLLASSHSYSNEDAIGIARMEYLERNVKENIYESVSFGLRSSAAAYDLVTPPEARTPQGREAALREGVLLSLTELGNYDGWDDDFELLIWCGYASERELDELPKKMRADGKAEGCDLCSEISNKECNAFVQVVQEPVAGDYVLLKGPEPPNPFVEGVVGVSVYSEKFDVAGVGVFPTSEMIR